MVVGRFEPKVRISSESLLKVCLVAGLHCRFAMASVRRETSACSSDRQLDSYANFHSRVTRRLGRLGEILLDRRHGLLRFMCTLVGDIAA